MQVIGKFGWFEYVFNMLLIYCVYYVCNVCYIDCNYVGVLVIWDCLFGSYVEEMFDDLLQYGIVEWFGLNNLFVVMFYEWVLMVFDVLCVGGWCNKLCVIFGLFEWVSVYYVQIVEVVNQDLCIVLLVVVCD